MLRRILQAGIAVAAGVLGLFVLALAAWLQHLYTSFSEEQWGFLIAGAILPPIGIIHGIGIWLGLW